MQNNSDTILILGGAGQDGRILATRLVQENHEVVSLVRPKSGSQRKNLKSQLVADLKSPSDFKRVYEEIRPSKIINLASMSSVAACESDPDKSTLVNFNYARDALEAAVAYAKNSSFPITFAQASSSEMYGEGIVNCDEFSSMSPKTVYGIHKLMAHQLLNITRNSASNIKLHSMIMFNHESEFRAPNFVSQKISIGAARVFLGKESALTLGNTASARDWGYAPDFIDAMVKILFAEEARDYVIATGKVHTVEDMLQHAFSVIGVADYTRHFVSDPNLYRKIETPRLVGNASRIQKELGWSPKTTFKEMVRMMVTNQIEILKKEGDL
jgi:GDPmannose 4,6-dehydratase